LSDAEFCKLLTLPYVIRGTITVLWDVTLQFGGQAAVTKQPFPASAHSLISPFPIVPCHYYVHLFP